MSRGVGSEAPTLQGPGGPRIVAGGPPSFSTILRPMRWDPLRALEGLPRWTARVWWALPASWALALTAWSGPRIPGLASGTLEPVLRGAILVEELNCVACHEAEGELKARSRQPPRLADLGSRLNPSWIERFIAEPHGTQGGTTMPDTLASLEPSARRRTARALTHFLLSTGTSGFSPLHPTPSPRGTASGCSCPGAASPVIPLRRPIRPTRPSTG